MLSSLVPLVEKVDYPELSLDDINTTFRVVTYMVPTDRLIVKDRQYLEIDRAYVRWTNSETRHDIINFLVYLYHECIRNTDTLLYNISHGLNFDHDIYCLKTYCFNLITFMSKLEFLEGIYAVDSLTASKIETIMSNFEKHYDSIFQKLTKIRS